MTEETQKIEGTVQETMLGPLWARATYSKLYPEILNDPKAIEIIEEIDYDFSEVEKFIDKLGMLSLLVRAKSFDEALIKFIDNNPNATIVSIGCGLDTTFYRVDNGNIKWYDLDLPDAIDFRKKYISDTTRSKCISKSVFDYSWFDDVEFYQNKGIFFIAGGFFYYFKEPEVVALLREMSQKFIRGELIFDAGSKLAIRIFNKRFKKKAGVKENSMFFYVQNPLKQISRWSNKIKVVDWFALWDRPKINPEWGKKTIRKIKVANFLKTGKIIQLRFME